MKSSGYKMWTAIALGAGALFWFGQAHAAADPGVLLSETKTPSVDRSAILRSLTKYELALNSSNVDAATAVYMEDGILMAPGQPPAIGTEAIRLTYVNGFREITLNIKFKVLEVVEVAPTWAFVRTASSGTIKINASGAKIPEANQELFVFKKVSDEEWKIARYSFSVTATPKT